VGVGDFSFIHALPSVAKETKTSARRLSKCGKGAPNCTIYRRKSKKNSGEGVVPPPQTQPHHTPSPRRLDPHTFGVTACPPPVNSGDATENNISNNNNTIEYCQLLLRPAIGEQSIVVASVSVSVREHISGTVYAPIFTKFSRPTHSYLWLWLGPLLARRCDMLCTSGFMDDVMFAHNGQYMELVDIPLQRVTSLRRRAPANAPAASYW